MRAPLMTAIAALCVAVPLFAGPVEAGKTRVLDWRDLAPGGETLVDPFAHLTGDQRLDIESVAWARAAERRGEISNVDPEYEIAVEMTDALTREGLDVDALVAKYDEFLATVEALKQRVDGDLHGQTVRLPGYALPLEFSGVGVREFLLVPYFGACIHVPPPPPNQMVFVRLERPFVMSELFEALWVTGRMSVERSSKSLSYIDGRADLITGYTLSATGIEPYEE